MGTWRGILHPDPTRDGPGAHVKLAAPCSPGPGAAGSGDGRTKGGSMSKPSLLLLLVALAARAAADGMLDPAFGTGGLVQTSFTKGSNDEVAAVALAPDGRYVVAGRSAPNLGQQFMAAARYLPDGTLDPTFDGDGRVVLVLDQLEARSAAGAVLLPPDGRLVLVGYSGDWLVDTHFALVRLLPNGSVDLTFGANGWVRTLIGKDARAFDGALLPDGRMLAVGTSWNGSARVGVAVRYLADGTLDPTFGTGGIAFLPTTSGFVPADSALLPDGRVVVGGTVGSATDLAAVRLLADGTPDPAFDGDGLAIAAFPALQEAHAVLAGGDGSVLVAGAGTGSAGNLDLTVTRFLPNGTLDAAFGTAGLVQVDVGSGDVATSLLQLPNGNLMVAGYFHAPPLGDSVLARLLPNGALDATFGTGGVLTTDFGGFDRVNTVALAGVERILVAGAAAGPAIDFENFALARYIAATPVELAGFTVE
jgi:uncharacterized delta-60 repeat protein